MEQRLPYCSIAKSVTLESVAVVQIVGGSHFLQPIQETSLKASSLVTVTPRYSLELSQQLPTETQ